ncbi:hypothetical protein GCM10020258_48420 [Sphingomonas yabuuchiae]
MVPVRGANGPGKFKMVMSPVRAEAPLLEICVDDADGVAAVVAAGADRIELCGALGLGGLTPSAALVAHAVESGVPVHAMVRPRDGDFRYDRADMGLATKEIRHMVAMGVAGVVVGAMEDDQRLDLDMLARWREAAAGWPSCYTGRSIWWRTPSRRSDRRRSWAMTIS